MQLRRHQCRRPGRRQPSNLPKHQTRSCPQSAGSGAAPFTTPPPPENQYPRETTVLDRMSLLGELHDDNPQPAFGRNRNIAGSLPDWSPQPPGEILINRRRP